MVKIEISNSFSKISGLKTDEFRRLRNELSYIDNPNASFYSGGWVRKKYLLDKAGNFPTGLLERVKALHPKATLIDTRLVPSSKKKIFNFDNTLFTPYPTQTTAAFNAADAGRGGIVMPTGTGKSLTIAILIHVFQLRTLIVVPTVEIKKQLQATVDSLFGLSARHIVIRNIDSPDLKELTDFDLLIIDEAHHVAAKTYHQLNKTSWKKIYHRFFFTATFFRNQEHEQLLFEGIAGKEIYRLTYKEAIRQKQIVPVEAFYINLPKQENDYYTYREVYDRFVIKDENRNGIIGEILANAVLTGRNTLCLVKEIDHGKRISTSTTVNFPFVNGADEESRRFIERFNAGNLSVLIGTTGVLGEGVDTKPAEYIIIAGLGKAKSAFMQQIGRGVRNYPGKESCKVILFRDPSHKYLLRHFKEQCKVLKEEYGVEVIKL